MAPEPKPDYSPEPERRASNGSAGRSKKVYQKTRFATDAAAPNAQRPAADGKPHERKKSFGESFRRLVGKFTGGGKSDADRKIKHRKKPEPERRRERADSGDYERGYDHGYGNDEHEYDRDNDGGGHDHYDDNENTYRSYDGGVRPASAERHQRLFGSTQTLDRHRAGRTDREAGTVPMNGTARNGSGGGGGSGVHRYYLGEDPFGGSIYGREREYDGAAAYNKRRHHKKNGVGNHQEQQHHTHYVQRSVLMLFFFCTIISFGV